MCCKMGSILVGVVGENGLTLALQSIWMGFHFEMGRRKLLREESGQLWDARKGEGVHEFEGGDGMQANDASGLCEESCSSSDAHERVLEIYEWTLFHKQFVIQ